MADSTAGRTPPSSATRSTPTTNSALSPPMDRYGSRKSTVSAQIADGTTTAANQDVALRALGDSDPKKKPRFLVTLPSSTPDIPFYLVAVLFVDGFLTGQPRLEG